MSRDVHHLELTVADAPAVLDRVVSTVRSRQCTIVSLRFQAGDRHRPGQIDLTVSSSARAARLAADRLARLVDVEVVAASLSPNPRVVGEAETVFAGGARM
jgi:acetolactate synthase regulatory subunit